MWLFSPLPVISMVKLTLPTQAKRHLETKRHILEKGDAHNKNKTTAPPELLSLTGKSLFSRLYANDNIELMVDTLFKCHCRNM